MGDEFAVIGEEPCALDPTQGDLTDSYFIAALSSLALVPSRIQKLFKVINKEKGYYVIKLYIDGD